MSHDPRPPHDSNDGRVTAWSAFITFFKSLFGAGILALPNAVGEVGVVMGASLMAVVTGGCAAGCYMLLKSREVAEIHLVSHHLHHCDDSRRRHERGDLDLHGKDGSSQKTAKGGEPSAAVEQDIDGVADRRSGPDDRVAPLDFENQNGGDDRGTTRAVSHLVTYGDLSNALLGPTMASLTRISIILIHILFTSGLVIAMTENLANAWSWEGTEGRCKVGAILFLPVALLLQISWLQDMYLISALGLSVYIFGVMGSVFYGALFAPRDERSTPTDLWDIKWEGLSSFIGTALYTMEGMSLAIPTAHSMRETDQHLAPRVVCSAVTSFGAIAVVFAAVGYAGGLGGGPGTGRSREECDVVSDCITPSELELVIQISLSIALLLSLPVMLYPSTEMLEVLLTDYYHGRKDKEGDKRGGKRWLYLKRRISLPKLGGEGDDTINFDHEQRQTSLLEDTDPVEDCNPSDDGVENSVDNEQSSPLSEEYSQQKFWILRVALAAVVMLIGSTVTSFTSFSAFVGAVILTFVGFILPPLLYIRAMRVSGTPVGLPMATVLFLMLAFGSCNMVVGGVSSLLDMIRDLR